MSIRRNNLQGHDSKYTKHGLWTKRKTYRNTGFRQVPDLSIEERQKAIEEKLKPYKLDLSKHIVVEAAHGPVGEVVPPTPPVEVTIAPTGVTQYENVVLTATTTGTSPTFIWTLTDFYDTSNSPITSFTGSVVTEGYFISTGSSNVSVSVTADEGTGSSSEFTVNAFDPLSTSPDWWYDMSDASTMTFRTGTDYVEQVNDKSGNARHLTQTTAAYQPLYSGSAINPSLSALTFNGIDEQMNYVGSSVRTISGQTYIGIGQNKIKTGIPGQPGGVGLGGAFFRFYDPTSSANNRYLYMNGTNWLMNLYYQTQREEPIANVDGGNDKVIYFRRENSTTIDEGSINGVELTITNTSQARTYDGGSVYFGWYVLTADYQTKLYGEHSELLHYHRTITDEEYNQVNRYLQYKWFGGMTY